MVDVTMQDYINARIEAIMRENTVAHEALDKRLCSMNEIREQLNRQAATFLSRDVYDISHDRVLSDIKHLQQWRAAQEGKASQNSVWLAYLLSLVGIVTGLFGLFL
jgi:hypothetical protein